MVWTDRLTAQDEAFKSAGPREPMELCVLLVERLSPQLGLNEETAKAAKPARWRDIMDERSGMPPESERTPLPDRQKALKESRQKATLVVFPARIGGNAVADASADNLTKLMNEAGLCQAVAAKPSVLLKASQADPNELKTLWDLAREFRDYVEEESDRRGLRSLCGLRLQPAELGAGIRAFRRLRSPGRVGHRGHAELASPRLPEHQANLAGRLRQTPHQTPGELAALITYPTTPCPCQPYLRT